MIKPYYTTLLIWLSLLTGELHSLWENSTAKANWILTEKREMLIEWNVKYATDELWFILMAWAMLLYKPNRINRTTVAAYLYFCIVDMCMYFYNYKREGYAAIYTFLLIAWVIIYNRNGKHRTDNRQRITIAGKF